MLAASGATGSAGSPVWLAGDEDQVLTVSMFHIVLLSLLRLLLTFSELFINGRYCILERHLLSHYI